MPHKAGNGAITGIVSEDGLPSIKRIVLVDRSNLSIIAKTVSDSDGAYEFTGLNPDSDDYLAFAVDDDGDPTKKAIIYDKIRPISAHMGGFYWANWYLLSMAKEPLVQFLGLTSGTLADIVLTGGAGCGHFLTSGANLIVDQQSITKGASSLPATMLNQMSVARYTLKQHNKLFNQPQNKASCEWVLDLDSVVGGVCVSLAFVGGDDGLYSDHKYNSTILQLRYGNRKLQLYRHNGNSISWNSRLVDNLVLCCEYEMTTQQGVVYIVGSIHYGESASLYINGINVVTASLEGQNLKAGRHNKNNITAMFIHSTHQASNHSLGFPATLTTGLVSFYGDTMTADEAMKHYQALTADTLPQATGYVKAVVQDYPSYLYRLNDGDSLTVTDRLRPNALGNGHELTKVGNVQTSTDSLIRGGAGMVFNGGGLRTNMLHTGVHSPYFLTIEFIAKPSKQTLSGWEMLISHETNGVFQLEVRRHNVSSKWCVQWRENNAEYLANFISDIDISAMHHYCFVIDKQIGNIKLYVDGVLTETLNINKLKMQVIFEPTSIAESLSIGGRVNSAMNTVVYPYYGYLAEVAIYPFALSQGQIQEHINAMSVL